MDIVADLVMIAIGKIKPYPGNPRHNTPTVEKLVELIPQTGFNVPLVLDRQNVIVKGHSRWLAAKQLGLKRLPVVYTDADDATIKLDRLADNRVHEFSTWDQELLQSELGALTLPNFDLGLLDFRLTPTAPEPGTTGRRRAVNGEAPAAGTKEEPFITEDEVKQTIGAAAAPQPSFHEITCEKCGGPIFIKK